VSRSAKIPTRGGLEDVRTDHNFVSGRTVWSVAGVCMLLAAVHSLLASSKAKGLVSRFAGPRRRNGLYRFGYNALSILQTAWAAWWFSRQPDRVLYRVAPPWSWAMRAGQVASLGVVLATVWASGMPSTGIPQLRCFLTGSEPEPEPEAQGPPPAAGCEEMGAAGPFRFSRHPSNLASITLFSLFPRMTANRAALAAVVTVYAVVGAVHEEHRLMKAYGAAYERYRRSVPFLVPKLARGR
jgi:hypothetical protein